MLATPALRRQLGTLPLTTEHGPWARAVALAYLTGPPPGATKPGPDPLWPGGSRLNGQRFTPKGSFDTAYLTESPVTALHEVGALLTVGGSIVPIGSNPQVLVTIKGLVANILDTTDPSIQHALATSTSELTGVWAYVPGGGRAPTQVLGEEAFSTGRIHGIKYTSAKDPPSTCLCVFTDLLQPPEGLSVVDSSGNLVSSLP